VILHITNGDSAGGTLRSVFPADRVLSWRDVVYNHPPREEFSAHLAGQWDEIVLWFEHDLYDQLQLIELLDELRNRQEASLIQASYYLGAMTPDQLAALWPARRTVEIEQFDAAARACTAFWAPNPMGLERMDSAALPWLGPALRRFVEEYPWVEDGCSRTERSILRAVESGLRTKHELFGATVHREDPLWMGDLPFFDILEELQSGREPLLTCGNTLTDKGRAVLAGKADRVRGNGIDRVLGGVHLKGDDAAFRWDAGAGKFQAK